MPKSVDTVVRINNPDAIAVQDAVKARLSSVFSSVKSTSKKANEVFYKGGSFLKPYGFKAKVTTEPVGDNATVVKLVGRPKMNALAYIAMMFVAVLLIFGLSNPVDGFWGLIAAVVMIIASVIEQRRVARQLEKVAEEIGVFL